MTPNQIPQIHLNNGVDMPMLGFGVYQIPAEQTEQAVTDALAAGYRLLDTAEAYGNEEAVGKAIAQGDVPRDELFVTTKLWIHSLMCEHGVQHESWGPFAEGKNNIFSDPVLSEIGEAHGKSVAQVILRWLTQRDIIVIPKSGRAERMRESIDVFDFELTDDEMARVAGLDAGSTLFFDHADPGMVSWLNSRKID